MLHLMSRVGVPGRPDPKPAISDRTLAIATYAALAFCLACIAAGLIGLHMHGRF